MNHVLSGRIFPRLYRDSVTLMALAATAQRREGVLRAGAVMATPANLAILAESQMLPEGLNASADDLLVAVRAIDDPTVQAALDAVEEGLVSTDEPTADRAEVRPATVGEGLARDPALTVAAVSTPGTYAPIVVEQALRHGLHVFCFSDNVGLDDEIRLKTLAVQRGRLLMGPDCGTAILDGVPLGFANEVRGGPVAIVAASGTGAQEVSCLLDGIGIGVSQIIGVGGRDLSQEVGGLMTHLALDLVSADEAVGVVVVVSKPPAPEVARLLLDRLEALAQPAVACLLGMADEDGPVPIRGTLEGGAAAAAAVLGRSLTIEGPSADVAVPSGNQIAGLYTGGTLAAEAKVVLDRAGRRGHIIDLGADEYTAGRPHPMIDPTARSEHVEQVGRRPEVGVLLVDLVLGHGACADPATPLADAVRTARAAARSDGRELIVAGSVCGTKADPQGRAEQRAILEAAGVRVFASNAAAVRFAIAATTTREGEGR